MKKFLAMAMALAMTLSLTACGGSGDTSKGSASSAEKPAGWWKEELSTVTDGKLTVATSPDFAPYEFYAIAEDGTPSLAGFDVALAGYVADYLGLELEMVPMDFDGVLLEVANGTVDLGMAGLSPDPTRADAMDFSDLYYEGGQSFWTTKENADKFSDLASANTAGISVGAQIASIQMDLANQYSADTDIIPLVKVTDIIAELMSGKLDGAYIETAVGVSYQANYPELVKVCDVPYEGTGSCIGVTKGNEALMAGVNEAIAAALADGSMDNFVAEANEIASGETASLVDGEIVKDEK